MADPKIRIRRSATPNKVPETSQLQLGELAINTFDGKLFLEQDQTSGSGIATVITVNPWSVGVGTTAYDTYFTAGDVGIGTTNPTVALDVRGDVNVSGALTASGFTGDLTGNADTATALQTAREFSVSGDASTATPVSFDGTGNVGLAITLSHTGVTSTSYGASNLIPRITVDATGRITSATTNPLAIIQDTTPELGGDLDLNSNDIYGTGNINITGIITATSFVGDGSGLQNVPANIGIDTNTTSSNQLITFAVSTGSTSGLGVTTGLVFNPSSTSLGIGSASPAYNLDVVGDINSSTAVRVNGVSVIDEALALAIALG